MPAAQALAYQSRAAVQALVISPKAAAQALALPPAKAAVQALALLRVAVHFQATRGHRSSLSSFSFTPA